MKEKRRYIRRIFYPSIIKKLFNIPKNEMLVDIKWECNDLIIETLLDYDVKEGDKIQR